MSQPLTLARPYARAAFELALVEQCARRVGREARVRGAGRGRSAGALAVRQSARRRRPSSPSLFLPDGESGDSPFASFMTCSPTTSASTLLPEIAALFEQRKREAEKVLQVHVRTATPIDAQRDREAQGRAEAPLRPRHRARADASIPACSAARSSMPAMSSSMARCAAGCISSKRLDALKRGTRESGIEQSTKQAVPITDSRFRLPNTESRAARSDAHRRKTPWQPHSTRPKSAN